MHINKSHRKLTISNIYTTMFVRYNKAVQINIRARGAEKLRGRNPNPLNLM